MGRYRAVTAREAAYKAKHSWSSRAILGDGAPVILRRVGHRDRRRLRPRAECPTADPRSSGEGALSGLDEAPLSVQEEAGGGAGQHDVGLFDLEPE